MKKVQYRKHYYTYFTTQLLTPLHFPFLCLQKRNCIHWKERKTESGHIHCNIAMLRVNFNLMHIYTTTAQVEAKVLLSAHNIKAAHRLLNWRRILSCVMGCSVQTQILRQRWRQREEAAGGRVGGRVVITSMSVYKREYQYFQNETGGTSPLWVIL